MTPGTIGVIAAEQGRFTRFYQMLDQLERPEGTKVMFGYGPGIVQNRNTILEKAIGDWILFIDDDQAFHTDTLLRLLKHGKDIVVPLILKRHFPYEPVVYRKQEDGEFHAILAKGLQKIDAAGTGMMLLRRNVWEKVGTFRYGGEGKLREDLDYCERATSEGFEIFCDFSLPVGHFTSFSVWPTADFKVALRNSNKTHIVERS